MMFKSFWTEVKMVFATDFAMSNTMFLRTYGIRVKGDNCFL